MPVTKMAGSSCGVEEVSLLKKLVETSATLLGTSATLVVTGALLVVTRSSC